jgi:hypothetical protein
MLAFANEETTFNRCDGALRPKRRMMKPTTYSKRYFYPSHDTSISGLSSTLSISSKIMANSDLRPLCVYTALMGTINNCIHIN